MNSQQKHEELNKDFQFNTDPEGVEYISFPMLGKDSIVESVVNQFQERSRLGIKKYNTTLDRTDLSLVEWLEHAKEEAMDQVLYLERAIKELKNA